MAGSATSACARCLRRDSARVFGSTVASPRCRRPRLARASTVASRFSPALPPADTPRSVAVLALAGEANVLQGATSAAVAASQAYLDRHDRERAASWRDLVLEAVEKLSGPKELEAIRAWLVALMVPRLLDAAGQHAYAMLGQRKLSQADHCARNAARSTIRARAARRLHGLHL